MRRKQRTHQNNGLATSPGNKGKKRNPVTEKDRQRVRELHAQGKSRNYIARDLQRSFYTISALFQELGLPPNNPPATKATEQFQRNTAERRRILQGELLDDIDYMRSRLRETTRVPMVVKTGDDTHIDTYEFPEPPLKDIRDLYAGIGTAVRSLSDLARLDEDSAANQAVSLLGSLAESFGLSDPDAVS